MKKVNTRATERAAAVAALAAIIAKLERLSRLKLYPSMFQDSLTLILDAARTELRKWEGR